jgi:hypothetical protein
LRVPPPSPPARPGRRAGRLSGERGWRSCRPLGLRVMLLPNGRLARPSFAAASLPSSATGWPS